MEVPKNNKKMYDIKPFKILNAELQDIKMANKLYK